MIAAMYAQQAEMKEQCVMNQSTDLFDASTLTSSQLTPQVVQTEMDDFFLANATFTMPRLHELMKV